MKINLTISKQIEKYPSVPLGFNPHNCSTHWQLIRLNNSQPFMRPIAWGWRLLDEGSDWWEIAGWCVPETHITFPSNLRQISLKVSLFCKTNFGYSGIYVYSQSSKGEGWQCFPGHLETPVFEVTDRAGAVGCKGMCRAPASLSSRTELLSPYQAHWDSDLLLLGRGTLVSLGHLLRIENPTSGQSGQVFWR